MCFWPATRHGFVCLDDPKYIYDNPHIRQGLTWVGMVWAFATGYASNWHPLTWLSHMLDCQLYGLNPVGHHLTNILLHAINGALLFLLLRQMTGSFWRSAFVAGLFAWHPTHVESVAWAAERKDVLSTLFFFLTLWAYVRYVQRAAVLRPIPITQETACESSEYAIHTQLEQPGADSEIENRKSKIKNASTLYFLLALFLFALGLMSKPMLVTLPFVLLLLDYWPLQRLSFASLHHSITPSLHHSTTPPLHLLLEKLPFFALSLAASLVTYFVQKAGGAVSSFTMLPFGARVANAVVAYVRYLSNAVWPAGLSVFYPLPDHWPLLTVVASSLVLLGLSWLAVRSAGRFPFLPVGWFWFLGTLVPTIGLVQVGSQSMADRYLYIPSIGLFIIAAWGLNEFAQRSSPFLKQPSGDESQTFAKRLPTVLPHPLGKGRGEGNSAGPKRTQPAQAFVGRFAPTFVALVTLLACLACTSHQIGYWQNEETLFRHAMEVTQDNYLAYDHLAKVCENAGRKEDALAYYSELLRLKPRYPEGQYNLGTLLMGMGQPAEAEQHLQAAVLLRASWAEAQSNLGLTQFRQNKLDEAINHLDLATRLDSKNPDTFVNLGVTLLAMNRPEEAASALSRASRLAPEVPEPQFLFALALSRERKCGEARIEAAKARQLALATGRQELALKANELLKVCESSSQITENR